LVGPKFMNQHFRAVARYSIPFNILSDMRNIFSVLKNVNRPEKAPLRAFGKEGLASEAD
jgi:hypothetical protein